MGIINFVGGEKGGVGKSFFVKILVSYYLQRLGGQPFVIYDCDDVNEDIYRVYRKSGNLEVEQVLFSRAEKELSLANDLLKAAQGRDVIVNLPAGVHKTVGEWFKLSRVKRQTKDLGIRMFLWYVCDGDRVNLELFRESQESVPIEHIFVRNMVRLDDEEWDAVLDIMREEGNEIDFGRIPVVRIDKLPYWEAQSLAQNFLSFQEFLGGYESERVGSIERNTVRYYLEDCLDNIDVVVGSNSFQSGGSLRDMTPKAAIEAALKEDFDEGEDDEDDEFDEADGDSEVGTNAEDEDDKNDENEDDNKAINSKDVGIRVDGAISASEEKDKEIRAVRGAMSEEKDKEIRAVREAMSEPKAPISRAGSGKGFGQVSEPMPPRRDKERETPLATKRPQSPLEEMMASEGSQRRSKADKRKKYYCLKSFPGVKFSQYEDAVDYYLLKRGGTVPEGEIGEEDDNNRRE